MAVTPGLIFEYDVGLPPGTARDRQRSECSRQFTSDTEQPFTGCTVAFTFPALMILRFPRIALTLLVLTASAPAQPSEIRKSLARISNTAQEANYRLPWLPGQTGGGTGTGWVVMPD